MEKSLPSSVVFKIIEKCKKEIKNNDIVKNICKEYGLDTDIIDDVPVYFVDLDISGKTNRGVVYLNNKLLKNNDFTEICGYLLHEVNHFFQQCFGEEATQGADDGDYLTNPFEQESFQYQVEYLANENGEEEAEEYVDDLLEYHDVDTKDKKVRKKQLMKNV